jgi:SNF2 family DNA or RNA helicase
MKTPLRKHQLAALQSARLRPLFAYFMEQGTGKTRVVLDEVETLHGQGQIQALVVVALNGVHLNWGRIEIPKHLSTEPEVLTWTGKRTKAFQQEAAALLQPGPQLKVLLVNVEAFSQRTNEALKLVAQVLARFRCMFVVDESSTIKSPSATRTKVLCKIAEPAAFRRILTGTPVTQGPLDLYAQFRFLAPGLLGFSTYTAFKAHYSEWREERTRDGKKYPVLVRYRNLEELKRKVAANSFEVMKRDCLDLPDKEYVTRFVQPTDTQRILYENVKRHILSELADGTLTVRHAFTKLTRLLQITGGHVQLDNMPDPRPVGERNPKIEALLQLVEQLPQEAKVIVWARFRAELHQIVAELGPRNCACYWGDVEGELRATGVDRFQTDPAARFFVGSPRAAGFGLTLTAASHVVYFSNDFSLEARLQSEDRAHRIGQVNKVTYHDLVMTDTIDEKVLKVLRDKKDLADFFKQDRNELMRWLNE